MRYRLRTLLVLLAILPPLLAVGWSRYAAWRAHQARRAAIQAELVAIESELALVNAGLDRWLKAWHKADPAVRDAEILRLQSRAMLLSRAKVDLRCESDPEKRVRAR